MSGPEIQANAIATVLAGLPLRSPGGAAVALILLLAATAPLAALRLGPLGRRHGRGRGRALAVAAQLCSPPAS